jgi:hypothetical protein
MIPVVQHLLLLTSPDVPALLMFLLLFKSLEPLLFLSSLLWLSSLLLSAANGGSYVSVVNADAN